MPRNLAFMEWELKDGPQIMLVGLWAINMNKKNIKKIKIFFVITFVHYF